MDKPKDKAAEAAKQEAERGGEELVELGAPELLEEMKKLHAAQETESARQADAAGGVSGDIDLKLTELGEAAPPGAIEEQAAQAKEADVLAASEKRETAQAVGALGMADQRAAIDALEPGWVMPEVEGDSVQVEGLDKKLVLQEEKHGEVEAKPTKEGAVDAGPKVIVEQQPPTPQWKPGTEVDLDKLRQMGKEAGLIKDESAPDTVTLEEWRAGGETKKAEAAPAPKREGEGFQARVIGKEQVHELRQLDADNKRLQEINAKLGAMGETGRATGTAAFEVGELEAEKSALEEKIAKARGEQVIEPTPETQKKRPEGEAAKAEAKELSPKEKEMREAGDMVAELQAKLHQFEGLGAAKLLLPGNRRKRENILADLENAKKEYAELRAEVVADNVDKFCDERMAQVESQRAALEKQKGKEWLSKGYQWYKKLGEMNLTKLGWNPTGRIGKIAARAMSVRTLASVGLLGAGLAAGAGAAVGVGAIIGRRLLAGIGTGVGSYDLMRMAAERQPGKFKPDDLEGMSKEEVAERLEKMEANAMVGGRSLDGNEAYGQLDGKFRELLKAEQKESPQEARLSETMKVIDERLEAAVGRSKRHDKIMKGVAVGIGGLVGSGEFAKGLKAVADSTGLSDTIISSKKWLADWLGWSKPAVPTGEAMRAAKVIGKEVSGDVGGEAAGTAVEDRLGGKKVPVEASEVGGKAAAATAAEAKEMGPPTPEQKYGAKLMGAAEVHKGDSYSSLIRRQLLADPERFGFDPAKHGDAAKWAREMTSKAVRDSNLISAKGDMRLIYDAKNPGHVYLEKVGDKFQVVREGVKQYAHPFEAPKPIEEIVGPEEASGGVKPRIPESVEELDMDQFSESPKRPPVEQVVDAEEPPPMREFGKPLKAGEIPRPLTGEEVTPPLTERDIPRSLTKEDIPQALTKEDIPAALKAEDLGGASRPASGSLDAYEKQLKAAMAGEIKAGAYQEVTYEKAGGMEKVSETTLTGKVEGGAFKFGDGSAKFSYDSAGRISGVVTETKLSPADNLRMQQMLKDGWLTKLKGPNPAMGRTIVESGLRQVVAEQKALDAMTKAGQGASAEASYLKQDIVRRLAGIKNRFGDILKK
jgi:hypothetical protein